MGALLIRAALSIGMLFPAACARPVAADPAAQVKASDGLGVTDSARLGNAAVQLVARDGGCILREEASARETKLVPSAPCYFLRQGGSIQEQRYPRIGVSAIVLVLGTPATAAQRQQQEVNAPGFCGTSVQGVMLKNDRLETSTYIRDGSVICRNTGLDEKNFSGAAHIKVFVRDGRCISKLHDGREVAFEPGRPCYMLR